MFGLSFWEICIIAILALILLGPDNLPDAARKAGKLMRDLRRATDEIKDQLETEIYSDELQRRPAAVPPVPAGSGASGAAPEASPAAAPEPSDPPPSYVGPRSLPDRPAEVEPSPAPSRPDAPGATPKA